MSRPTAVLDVPGGLLALLNLAIGLYFGTMGILVSFFAISHGVPGAAAPIIAAASLSGLLSGWLYVLRRHPAPARRQLIIATAYLTTGALLLPLAPSAIWLGAAVVVTEAAVPPTLALLNVLAEKAVHPAVLTQAFTWNNSASAAGSALAASLAGRAADAWVPPPPSRRPLRPGSSSSSSRSSCHLLPGGREGLRVCVYPMKPCCVVPPPPPSALAAPSRTCRAGARAGA